MSSRHTAPSCGHDVTSCGQDVTACGHAATAPRQAATSALITNVQRYSLHDGGGIRTVAFLKGCPFSCPWCCNPENLSFEPEVSLKENLCIHCSPRPDGALCAIPPALCPTRAKTIMGTKRSVDDLLEEVLRDRIFFEESGGGVTLSGGEALAREPFVRSFFAAAKAQGLHTALETTLALPLQDAQALVAVVDSFLVDFKIADRATSKTLLGLDPDVRDANLRTILSRRASVVARMPIVPGYTDGLDNVRANAAKLCELGIVRADVLPFHQLGENKYSYVGRPYTMHEVQPPSAEQIAGIVAILEKVGLSVVIDGE
ncbi:radical SAM protein [Atopobium minutum]|uniref:radical SAM protein n=1 Tax=Atopobium minutum TaxID=1381 RepID=UPI00280B2FDC|nr:radical SAM protein [Atopobium minutum]